MNFNIGKVNFGGDKTVVIAEAGVNHLGRMDYAEELIKSAKRAGADIIKFQTYKASKLTTKKAPRFWSWKGEKKKEGSQYDSYSVLDSFDKEQYIELTSICKKYDIEFMSTPFDNDSADMLVELGMKGFKIASCDITNIPFLEHIGSHKLPVLISTGASNLFEIEKAILTLEKEGVKKIGIMQCTLCYPTEPKDANLNAIKSIKEKFKDYLIGFSDHTLGNLITSASIMCGVKFIEKHYTFDKTLPDSADHWLSLDEEELGTLVKNLRILELALGSSTKEKKECEELTYKYARRSLVSLRNIKEGTKIVAGDIGCKRPGTGIPPSRYSEIVGSVAKKFIESDILISENDILWKK
jgi:sialic acid synthase SpsE